MRTYILRRLLYMLPILAIVCTVVFVIVHLTPGDPAAAILGENATEEQLATLRTQLGLDRPVVMQYFLWLGRLLHGDVGDSLFFKVPVLDTVVARLQPTMLLAAIALLFRIAIGIPLGIFAAVNHNRVGDQSAMVVALLGVSIPNFWLGLNLILIFSVFWHLLPAAGFVALGEGPGLWPTLRTLILPGFTIGFSGSALVARMTRANLLEVLREDYVRTARAKGLRERVVIYKHALRNAMIPTLTVIGLSVAGLMNGALVTEQVFAIPGLGMLFIYAVRRRDYPVVQGLVLFIAFTYVMVNLLVDLSYAWVDPRIRYS